MVKMNTGFPGNILELHVKWVCRFRTMTEYLALRLLHQRLRQ